MQWSVARPEGLGPNFGQNLTLHNFWEICSSLHWCLDPWPSYNLNKNRPFPTQFVFNGSTGAASFACVSFVYNSNSGFVLLTLDRRRWHYVIAEGRLQENSVPKTWLASFPFWTTMPSACRYALDPVMKQWDHKSYGDAFISKVLVCRKDKTWDEDSVVEGSEGKGICGLLARVAIWRSRFRCDRLLCAGVLDPIHFSPIIKRPERSDLPIRCQFSIERFAVRVVSHFARQWWQICLHRWHFHLHSLSLSLHGSA